MLISVSNECQSVGVSGQDAVGLWVTKSREQTRGVGRAKGAHSVLLQSSKSGVPLAFAYSGGGGEVCQATL